jgi:L,D-peptidoglycan transpeptidase YkuD (ErfK/YbiS/YcfS/YnhG family)
MTKYKFLWLFAFVLLPAFAFVIIKQTKNKAPEFEMIQASKMITLAQNEKSPQFAKNTFEQAKMYYDSAMMEWKIQNEKFIVFRTYQKVKYWALKSIETSENAISNARKNMANAHEYTGLRIEKIGKLFNQFESLYGNFPKTQKARDEITACKLLYAESLQAYTNKNYSTCNAKLDSVEITLDIVLKHYQSKLTDSFKDYTQWNKMIEHTLNQSKKNKTYTLVVDKLSRKLKVYKNGASVKQYNIELGSNWLGSKQQQGDKATPEGYYKIIDKKQNGHTKYYKALLLNYPNDEDKKRFTHNKKHGLIEADASIGNLIEIHGNGGQGIDWTDGCIALNNTDMDELFQLCSPGTPVTIVGSVKTLNEFIHPLK